MTVHSMTGFAHASAEYAGKNIDIEIRSVNHRFLDVQFKLPDDLRCLESNMREKIVSKIARGKLECRIQLGSTHQQQSSLHINRQGNQGQIRKIRSPRPIPAAPVRTVSKIVPLAIFSKKLSSLPVVPVTSMV